MNPVQKGCREKSIAGFCGGRGLAGALREVAEVRSPPTSSGLPWCFWGFFFLFSVRPVHDGSSMAAHFSLTQVTAGFTAQVGGWVTGLVRLRGLGHLESPKAAAAAAAALASFREERWAGKGVLATAWLGCL